MLLKIIIPTTYLNLRRTMYWLGLPSWMILRYSRSAWHGAVNYILRTMRIWSSIKDPDPRIRTLMTSVDADSLSRQWHIQIQDIKLLTIFLDPFISYFYKAIKKKKNNTQHYDNFATFWCFWVQICIFSGSIQFLLFTRQNVHSWEEKKHSAL